MVYVTSVYWFIAGQNIASTLVCIHYAECKHHHILKINHVYILMGTDCDGLREPQDPKSKKKEAAQK